MPLSQFDRENVVPILQGHGDWFTAQLMRLVVKADGRNRTLLARGFPEEVQLVEQAWGLTSTEPEALLREAGQARRELGERVRDGEGERVKDGGGERVRDGR